MTDPAVRSGTGPSPGTDPSLPRIDAVRSGAPVAAEAGAVPVTVRTARGDVDCRLFASPGATAAAVMVGGVGGGWDTPALGMYPALAGVLPGRGVACLRVRFRASTRLHECLHDVLAGVAVLRAEGARDLGLVGHSLGGAVVIAAAARCPAVRTVVALSPQTLGAEAVGTLAPRCSLLIAHGTADPVIPFRAGRALYDAAGEPKELLVCERAGHVLDEVAPELHTRVADWLAAALIRSEDTGG